MMRAILFSILFGLTTATSDVLQSISLKYENYTVPDMRFVCLNFEVAATISAKCEEQLEVVCGNMNLFSTMLDASSKFPYTGLGYASRMDYGNFDQCLTVDHEYEGGRILGKHCNVGLIIPDFLGNSPYLLATCMPDGCSADDFNAIAKTIVEDFPPLFQDGRCQTVESYSEISAVDIVTITIFAVCTLFMIFCTIYDIYLDKTGSKSAHPLYLAFSVISNGKKLLQISKNSKEQIQSFHGIKVISMMWIVAGHGFVGWQSISVSNKHDVDTWLHKRYAGYISTAPLAVDTFFFISGFLLAFQYFKSKPKPLMVQVSAIPQMYIHRYLRLTPAMLMIYLVTISVFKHLGTGPLWTSTEALSKACTDNWWSFFLYIQNYYNWDNLCLTQTWYLSADMQMFLLAPFVLIPISLHLGKSSGFMASMIELFILNLFCIALPMALKLVFQDYANEYDTHSRLINYFIGLTLALFMRVKQDKPFLYGVSRQNVSVVNLCVWMVILLGMLTTVICYQEVEMNHGYESRTVFHSLMRPAWCIGLSWIVYSCYHGYGGIVNWLLSNSLVQILGRLTYCIYLIHLVVEVFFYLSVKTQQYFTDYNAFYAFCGHYTMTIIISVYWTLAFESPLIVIEKHMLGRDRKKSKSVVNSILSSSGMQIMSRLTYCMYLTHGSVITYFICSTREKLYFTDYIAFYTWCGNFAISTVLSIFWTLAFESPLIIIEKHFLGKHNNGGKQQQYQNEKTNMETREENVP